MISRWEDQRVWGQEFYWTRQFGLCRTDNDCWPEKEIGKLILDFFKDHLDENQSYELIVEYTAICEREERSYDTPGYYWEDYVINKVTIECGVNVGRILYDVTTEVKEDTEADGTLERAMLDEITSWNISERNCS